MEQIRLKNSGMSYEKRLWRKWVKPMFVKNTHNCSSEHSCACSIKRCLFSFNYICWYFATKKICGEANIFQYEITWKMLFTNPLTKLTPESCWKPINIREIKKGWKLTDYMVLVDLKKNIFYYIIFLFIKSVCLTSFCLFVGFEFLLEDHKLHFLKAFKK